MSIFEKIYILFKDLFNFIYIYVHMLVTVESREGIRCPEAMGTCEPPYVEYGNQTWVFCRDSKLS